MGCSAPASQQIRIFPYETDVSGQNGADIVSLGTSADGKRIVVHSSVGGHLGGPVVLEIETGAELRQYRVSSEAAWVQFSAPSPDGVTFAYSRKNAVHLLDLKSGDEVRKFEGAGQHAFYVAFSADGKQVAASVRAAGQNNDWIECWDVATGRSVHVLKGPTRITSLAFAPDGTSILSGGEDMTARLWRLAD